MVSAWPPAASVDIVASVTGRTLCEQEQLQCTTGRDGQHRHKLEIDIQGAGEAA